MDKTDGWLLFIMIISVAIYAYAHGHESTDDSDKWPNMRCERCASQGVDCSWEAE